MPKLVIRDTEGEAREIEAQNGLTLMEAITNEGFEDLLALCGGACSCATCHVYVQPEYADKLPAMEDMEDQLLDSSDCRKENSRLSCQIPLTDALDGMHAEIAPEE